MHYLLLFFSVTLDTLKNTYYNYFGKNMLNGHRDTLRFNAINCVGAVIYFLCRGGSFSISGYSFCMALIFSVVTVAAQYFQLLSMALGSMAYSTLFTYLSVLISALFSVFYYAQPVSVLQVVGFILMVVSFFLSCDLRDRANLNLKWLAAALGSFVSWGLVGICQQLHQNSAYASELSGFLLWTFLFSGILFGILFLFTKKDHATATSRGFLPLVLMVLTGAAIGVINEINLYLSGAMPGIIFFPIVNGGVIILTTLTAVFLFREKLSKTQLIGLIAGMIAVLCLGM